MITVSHEGQALCHWRAINPGQWRYATVKYGQPSAQLKPHDWDDPGDLQATGQGFESP